ncbi:uncharacterized protein LOC132619558 [Lycium barbarum]|uniref:uncharacterized protein LOC132619558 n=1 Tax=Lycium barbarum TaxID=112863 RepID=UPI00293F5D2A|nr:uncharacterized protein LOC132619558 [Lycium barbarum]
MPIVNEVAAFQLPPNDIRIAPTTNFPQQAVNDDDDFTTTPPGAARDTDVKGFVASESPPHKKRRQLSVGGSSSKKADLVNEPIPTPRNTARGESKRFVSPKANEAVPPTPPFAQCDIQSTSKEDELPVTRKEFDKFKKSVKEEFNDLRDLMNDNLTKILQAIKGNNDSDKQNDGETHRTFEDDIFDKSPVHEATKGITTTRTGIVGDVGLIKVNSSEDTLMGSTEEIKEEGVISGEHNEPEAFGSQFPINTSQQKTSDMAYVDPASIHSHSNDDKIVDTLADDVAHVDLDEHDSKQLTPYNVDAQKQGDAIHQETQFELPDELLPSQRTISRIVMTLRKDRRPGPLQISPYLSNFSLASGSSVKLTAIFDKKHSFEQCCITGAPDKTVCTEFSKRIRDGLLVRHESKKSKYDHYKKGKATLPYFLDCGIKKIKKLIYLLAMDGQLLNDEHIDVIFYYLRKKCKYDTNSTYKFTTVNCLFNTRINDISKSYGDPDGVANLENQEDVLCEYVKGHRIICTLPWHMVDNVFIPSFGHDVAVKVEIDKLSSLLPLYLHITEFYQLKKGIDWDGHPAYKEKSKADRFKVVYVENLAQQTAGSMDWGVYVAAYAEYLSLGNGIPAEDFDVELLRTRYAALIWDYARQKMEAKAISDDEAPPKPVRAAIDFENVEKIVLT